MAKSKITIKAKSVSGYVDIGKETKGGKTKIKRNMSAIRQAIITNIKQETGQVIVKEIFPQMEKDMKTRMDSWGKNAYLSKDDKSVYNTFKYPKKLSLKTKNPRLHFGNYAVHVNALIEGVAPKTGPWYVGNWVKDAANAGVLKNKSLLQRKDGSYPQFIMGIGETKRRKSTKLRNKLSSSQNQLNKLKESKLNYKGKAKQIKLAKRKTEYYSKKVTQAENKKKFSALVKGRSRRDFWSPSINEYFGNVIRQASSETKTTTVNESIYVKKLSKKIISKIKKVGK